MNTQPTTSEDDQLDPDNFDLLDWLTPEGDKTYRRRETVTVYKDTGMSDEVQAVQEERRQAERQAAVRGDGEPDLAVGETIDTDDLDRREAELHERINSAKLVLTITGMLQPEIKALTKNLKPEDEMYEYTLLAESVDFPGNQKLTPNQWGQFRNTIGEGQFQLISKAWTNATYSKPRVTAPFSRRS